MRHASAPSITARFFHRLLRSTLKPGAVGDDFVDDLRSAIDRPPPTLLPRGVGRRPLVSGKLGSTAGEWVGVESATRHVILLHGGYYVAGSPASYRNLAGRLAVGAGAQVFLVDYRRAPEHPYPAALEDAMTVYRALLDDGVEPTSIAIVGDSAGGGLALALLLRIRTSRWPLPAAAVLFSPWTDLTCSNPSIDRNDGADAMLSADALRAAATLYAADHDVRDPELSSIGADLAGLPPLFVTVDRSELLFDDAKVFSDRAREADVKVHLEIAEGLFHIWPVLVPFLPEARATVRRVIAFLDQHLAPRASRPR